MSKYMQLTVRVRPYYEKDLENTYPKLARHLRRIDPNWANQDPSLYDVAARLDILLYRSEGTPFRDLLLKYRESLLNLHASIQESMADWRLAQADQLLYKLEDIFDEVEARLS
jgi:hypothetical protein